MVSYDDAVNVISVVMFILGLSPSNDSNNSQKLESLAEDTYKSVQDIIALLENIDEQLAFENAKFSIKYELNSLNLLKELKEDPTSEEWRKWATHVVESIGGDTSHGALEIIHQLIIKDYGENLLEIFRDKTQSQIDSDLIHTETLTRRMIEYFLTLQSWQALGQNLLFQANEYLYGPSGNNFDYKAMIVRSQNQSEKFKEIFTKINDSSNYVQRADILESKDELWFDEVYYAHLEEIEVTDSHHVVIGFQLFKYYGNRLAIRIKQGIIKEMGVIGNTSYNDEWVDPKNTGGKEGEDFKKLYEYNKKVDLYHYMDLSFIQIDPGKAIVGIRFCVSGNRIGLCVKTMEVDFITGNLIGELKNGEWTDPPWGKKHVQIRGHNGCFRLGSSQIVETNPPAIMTGVGIYEKQNVHTRETYLDGNENWSGKCYAWALKAKDIFEFTETTDTGKSCKGDFSNFHLRAGNEGDDLDCCDGFAYNKTKQICTGDGKGPYFIGEFVKTRPKAYRCGRRVGSGDS